MIKHHVKKMGESMFTDCGIKFINTSCISSENWNNVNCKKCLELSHKTGGKK